MSGNISATELPHPGLKLTAAIWALLFARWFTPAEATAEGGTLWLVLATGITAAVWAWQQTRSERPWFYRDRITAVVLALVATHLLSAGIVLTGRGQKLLAANMFLEWIVVGVQFVLLQQTLLTSPRRRAFLQASLLLWTVLAGLGMWQHFSLFPQRATEYAELRAEFDRLQTTRPVSAEDARRQLARLNEIRRDCVAQGVPLDGPARGLFERRLRDSTEPMAFFALANSLGGMLASSLLLLAPLSITRLTARGSWRTLAKVVPLLVALIVGCCLLLTKSRTAWVGTFVALGVWGMVEACRKAGWLRTQQPAPVATSDQTLMEPRRRRFGGRSIVVSLVVLGLLVGIVTRLGGLDTQVLSEAPKSLRYRLEYWTATARLIAEYPLTGVGPGNFRSHYLRHKLATASEEIADPHSFVFDVLANAGLLGGLAVAALLVTFVKTSWPVVRAGIGGPADSDIRETAAMGTTAIATAVAFVVGYEFVMQAQWNVEVLLVGGSAVVLAWLFGSPSNSWFAFPNESTVRTGAALGVVALLVHLLGAGGFAHPAILNWLLALMAITALSSTPVGSSVTTASVAEAARSTVTPRVMPLVAIGCLALTLLVGKLNWLPMLQTEALLLQGDIAAQAQGQIEAAREAYFLAHQASPWDPKPLLKLAQIEFLISEHRGDDSRFQAALAAAQQAESRDPFNGNTAFEVGHWYQRRFERARHSEDARASVEWLQRAVQRYPSNPAWNAALAFALRDNQQMDQARQYATRTLEFEAINQRAGHLDRLLPQDVLQALQKLAQGD